MPMNTKPMTVNELISKLEALPFCEKQKTVTFPSNEGGRLSTVTDCIDCTEWDNVVLVGVRL